jgi:Flp pilus assembly protein TadB
MVIAAFIFGLVVFLCSFFFVFHYIQSHKSMRANHLAATKQRARQLKVQADLQARMDREAREFEETRQALLRQAGDDDSPDHQDIGHAA